MRRAAAALAALLLLSLPAEAGASTLLTGPFTGFTATHAVTCDASNTSDKKSIDVNIEIISGNGTVVDSTTRTIAPLATEGITEFGPLGVSSRKCRFSFPGSRRKVRGTLTGFELGADLRVLVVIDAQ